MTNHNATPEQWDELRARVAKLEAQGRNLKGFLTSSTSPPEPPTDDELQALWHELFSHDDTVSSGDVEVIARAVLERWGHG
jgi:hypothetical protein